MENTKNERKLIKKDTRCIGSSLLIYELIGILITIFLPLLTHLFGFGDSIAADIATIAAPPTGSWSHVPVFP